MLDPKRQSLLERQYQLVALLTLPQPQLGPSLSARARLVRNGLATKRRREALCCWPTLKAALGDQGLEQFGRYASQNQRPKGGCPRHDGFLFAHWLIENPCTIASADLIAERITTEFTITGGSVRPAAPLIRQSRYLGIRCRHLVHWLKQEWLARTAQSKAKTKLNPT